MRRTGGAGTVAAVILAMLLSGAASDLRAAPEIAAVGPGFSSEQVAARQSHLDDRLGARAGLVVGVEHLGPGGGGDHERATTHSGTFSRPPQAAIEPRLEGPQYPSGFAPTANPALRPGDSGWVARRLAMPALGIDVGLYAARPGDELFPPYAGAYIHSISSQPGRGTNTYIFAHAVHTLFLPLWNARVGQEVLVQMSDGQVLRYLITAVVRDVPCPDPTKPKPSNLPPALANATACDTSWMMPTPSERLTLQTSQGLNRNYGELVVVAEPAW